MATQTNTAGPEIAAHQPSTVQEAFDPKVEHHPEQYGNTHASPYYAPPQYSETANTMVTPLHMLGEHSAEVDCPFCQRRAMTRVGEEHSTMTWLSGVVLGFFCICLACLPCIAHSCQEIDHYCGNCGKQLTHRPYEGQVQLVGVPPAAMVPSQYPMTQAMPPQHPHPTQHEPQAQQAQEPQLTREELEQRELDAHRAQQQAQQPAAK
ncbi:unnamed protein product [Zymoseptoria tritici ST99CH_1A5]|uniref:LITAF domain-containing protein n=2 Tax=Zymoseptoria tritici TaxID=1047171 RepID=A0A1X7RYR4_ZYMT9|nr:unnamed protein product [Zymoseptoria tritici ST99CH_3D7]SMY26160.1 unnamed protein product [Zymoseptoria tritici ST99CH_1A5]